MVVSRLRWRKHAVGMGNGGTGGWVNGGKVSGQYTLFGVAKRV